MSHFTVLVIGPDHESQLAPFQENNMGDCPKEYLTFTDEEDEMLKKYQTEKTEVIIMTDGRKLSRYNEAFRNPDRALNLDAPSHIVPNGLKITEVPFTEAYATFEDYARDYERGTMGWWGNVHNEKNEETWVSMFSKLIDDLPDDTLLTVVDCHI
jgi:hypothetical protein